MDFETIAEVYAANDGIRERLLKTVAALSDAQAARLSEKGDWTVAGIVEHLAMVENGMTRIAAKLLKKAAEDGRRSDGTVSLSAVFVESAKGIDRRKFEAPEVVQPSGEKSIGELLPVLEANREMLNGLRETFETVEGTEMTFPHPVFGDMTAQDWLVLIGAHESRHIDQIERILGNR